MQRVRTSKMRFNAPKHLAVLLALHSVSAFAQDAAKPGPAFTLTLRRGLQSGEFPKNTQRLIVRLTNVSDTLIREDACEAGGALFRLNVIYNGIRQKEPAHIRTRRETAEKGEKNFRLCMGSNPGRHISKGEYWEDLLNYQTVKPGRYEFTVDLKLPQASTGPIPEAKSNTLTVDVP